MTTPEQEARRIADTYSRMSDEELGKIAESGFELSETAIQALQTEMTRRRLDISAAPPHGTDVYELKELVTIRKFRDLPEALLAKGSPESAGIESHLADDNIIRMDWFYSNLIGGIKLNVRPEDVDEANEILNQPIPESLGVEGVGEYDQPKCPQCQSLDVSYRELEKVVSYGSAYLGIPVPVHKAGWSCHACGNEWQEEGVDDQPASDSAGS
jgi:hypothetical protein